MNRIPVWARLAALGACLFGLGWLCTAAAPGLHALTPERVRAAVVSFGVWAPLVYLLAYGQPLVPLPASVMTITGGLVFGPGWGVAAAVAGATLRACAAFAVARRLGRGAVAKLMKGRIAALDEKMGADSFNTVLLIRLIPNLPFDVQNYGLGLTRVRFAPYALATFLGILPGSFVYVYLGYSLTDPQQIWKLLLAILMIGGLLWGQGAWKARQATKGAS